MCGEKLYPWRCPRRYRGSPPRMRGKEKLTADEFATKGITPAYAGKSGGGQVCKLLCQDHPRVCGEKPFKLYDFERTKGSPPRMRGKEQQTLPYRSCTRITPAYAGKSDIETTNTDTDGDHPRVCGEKTKKIP